MQSRSRLLFPWSIRPLHALPIAFVILFFWLAGSLQWVQFLNDPGSVEFSMQLSNPRSFRPDLLPPGALVRIDFELRNHSNHPLHNLIVVLPYRPGQLAYVEGSGQESSSVLHFVIAELAPAQSWHGYALFRLNRHLPAETRVTLQAAVVQARGMATSSAPAIIEIESINPHPAR